MIILNNQDIKGLVKGIKIRCDRTSQYYGRLLEWHSDFVNHYGIGLSDQYLFSTGEYPLAFFNNGGYNPDAVRVFNEYFSNKGLHNLIKSP